MNTIGSGLPTSGTPTATPLPSLASDTYRGIAFVHLDGPGAPSGVNTLYVADNDANAVRKFTFNGTNWSAMGASATLSKVHGLVALDTGGRVMLFATETTGKLYRLFDGSGFGGTLSGTPDLLATPTVGVFYGLAWTPEATPPAAVPNVPTGAVPTAAGNSLTAAWSAPVGGAAPAYYVLEVSHDGFATVDQTLVVYGTSQQVNGLTVGSNQFRVRAVNSKGGSANLVSAPFIAAAPPTTGLPDNTAFSGVIGDVTDPLANTGIAFTVSDPVDAAGSLVVTATSSNPAVVPNANIAATNTGGSVALKINPVGVGYADIIVTVTNTGHAAINRTIKYAASANTAASASTRWHAGRSDASTAILLDASTMLVGDDEAPAQDGSGNALAGGEAFSAYAPGASGAPLAQLVLGSGLGLASAGDADCSTAGYTGLANCKTDGEVDLESSFQIGSRIYVAGSHSNNKNGRSRPDRWRFFAVDASGTGASASLSAPTGYYKWLREDLRSWDSGNSHGLGADYLGLVASSAGANDVAQAPEADTLSGFSIEGMSTSPDDAAAWLGFRAPLVAAPGQPAVTAQNATGRTHALIVQVTNFTALASAASGGVNGTTSFGAPIRLDLGGRGIREIRKNGANQYLIIAGPPNGANGTAPQDFRLYSWDGSVNAAGLATNLHLRDANLAAFTAPNTACAAEGIGTLPADVDAGGDVQVLSDCGDTDFYGDGSAAKDLAYNAWKKFRTDSVALAALPSVALTLGSATTTSQPFTATASQTGTFYWVALPAAANAPAFEQVAAGQDGTGAATPLHGSSAVTSGVAAGVTITGLASGSGYKLYGVTVSSGGFASAVAAQAFTTVALIPQAIGFSTPAA
ncbi:MAG TPA: DUF3616 domain-containing protein, partial [Burkholderiaceae bacterium]